MTAQGNTDSKVNVVLNILRLYPWLKYVGFTIMFIYRDIENKNKKIESNNNLAASLH